jgi:integrase
MSRPSNGYQLKQLGGVWYITWSARVPGSSKSRSQRRSTGARDRKTAEEVMAAFILEKNAVERRDVDMPVSFVLDDYWNNHACRVESAGRIVAVLQHLKTHFGTLAPNEVTAEVVASYVGKRRTGAIGRPSGDGTLRRELGVLIAALNFAVRARKLDPGKVPYIALPPDPAPKDRWLERDEAERLRAACMQRRIYQGVPNLRLRLFVEIALNTAARRGAIEGLKWSQVDMNRGIIDFNPPGRRQTAKRRAKVPISDTLRPWLWKAKDKWPDEEYVLGKCASIKAAFLRAADDAGLQPPRIPANSTPAEKEAYRRLRVTPHTCRHTWATWAAQSGVSMDRIAAVLGDTVNTVVKKYVHWSPDYLRDAVNAPHAKENETCPASVD